MSVILLASATIGLAQTSGYPNRQQVQPGAVSYVEGQVSVDGQQIQQQTAGQLTLHSGETLDTGNGYAEVLLTPGTFLRVGNNSEFRMEASGLADTRINLVHGEALMEVDQIVNGTRLSVDIGNNSAEVLKKGLYSFDANQQAARVLDGKLKVVSATKSREIGKDDQVLFANGDNLKKTDFEARQMKTEPLYVWSEARSRQESGANQLSAENSAGYVPAGSGWFWDPYESYYGYWPTSAFLYSPFGFGFYGGYYPGYYHGYRGYRGYGGIRYAHPAGFHASIGTYHGSYGHMSHGGGGHR